MMDEDKDERDFDDSKGYDGWLSVVAYHGTYEVRQTDGLVT